MIRSATPRTPLRDLLEFALVASVAVADAYGLVPLSQTVLQLPLAWLLLRLRRQRWSDLGFTRPPSCARAILIGSALGIALELLAVLVTTPFISHLFGKQPDYSPFHSLRGNAQLLLLFLGFNWTLAAFGEELCFRGFLMNRLAGAFGGATPAWIASLVLCSALFGWGHTEQGISGWLQEGLSGLLLGAIYLASRRNLAIPIVAHGVSNTLAFCLMYLGRYPGFH